MKSYLRALQGLFFPDICPVCNNAKSASGGFMCAACFYDFPLTRYPAKPDNLVVELFWGHIPIVQACSLFWFVHESGYRKMVHALKYYGRWQLGEKLGEWLGREMEEGGLYGSVDVVVPVPLHTLRRLRRGYNQAEYIAQGVAAMLERPVETRAVARSRYNKSQTQSPKEKRWENVEGIFTVRRVERLAGKHILLVDDILTTGATIISCAEAILAAVPDCRISVATLGASKSHLQKTRGKKSDPDNVRIL